MFSLSGRPALVAGAGQGIGLRQRPDSLRGRRFAGGQGRGPAMEEQATAVMKKKEYTVRINLNRGKKRVSFFTTDFSFDYVKINASYRS
jgi:N-acetylglutamate synthase/N-acetylornithine aminotransferase